MVVSNYVVVGLSVILLVFLITKEVNRANKQRLAARLIASVVAVVSLSCLAFSITFTVAKTVDERAQLVLLTNGYSKDSLFTFLNENATNEVVYTTDPELVNITGRLKPKLTTAEELTASNSTIHVFGYGLNNEELNGLGKTSLVFHPNALPTGFSAITWQKKLAPGDRLFVQGRFNNSLSNPVKVVLTGLHTHLDSVMLPANSHINFQLKTIPRHLDRAVYNLVVFNKKDTVGIEDLPVEIEEKKRLQILILSASPDFENKFLKNRLSQNGYSIAIRSRISKNIFQKEYVNVQGISLDNISGSLPDKFDVVIADATELRSINRSELLATQSAVQKGIGLIVKADSSSNKSAFYLRDFSVVKGKATTNKNIALHLKNSHDTIPRFVVENTFHIRFRPGIQSIISDDGGAIFAANVLYGNGKIVLTTLQNTYALQLAGNQINYDDIWSALLNAAAKKDLPVQVVTTSPALPRVHQPVSVSIKSTVANPEPLQFGEEKVYLQQDKLLPFKYTGTYWPRETGWLPNVSGEGKINWLYIYKNSGWYALNAFTKATATAQYARDNQPSKSNKKRLEKDVPVSVPKIYFLIIFITSAGFLWFEKKLS